MQLAFKDLKEKRGNYMFLLVLRSLHCLCQQCSDIKCIFLFYNSNYCRGKMLSARLSLLGKQNNLEQLGALFWF